MAQFPKKLQEKLSQREVENSLRILKEANSKIDFSSNDYLGFAKNETLFANTFQLLLKEGISQNGATGSRLLSGNHRLYRKLEEKVVQFHEAESALVFNSGYDANIGLFSSVPQRGDLVFYDELVHASIRDGIKMGNAKNYKFKHNDISDLKDKIKLLVRKQTRMIDTVVYIVTESVFSMDGDSPDLKALTQMCSENNYRLIVDEAHAVGVLGNNGTGLVQQLNLQDNIFARVVTFGKALGCHGAAVLGSAKLKDYLVNFSRSLIYSTALPPHTLAAIVSSYDYLRLAVEDRQRLQKNIEYFKQKLRTLKLDSFFIPSDSAIQSCLIPGNEKVKSISKRFNDDGFDIKAILSPTVAEGHERLRFCIHSFNTEEDIAWVSQLLKKYL